MPMRKQFPESKADLAIEDEIALSCQTYNDDPSLTMQSFSVDADLNVIAKRFGLLQVPSGPIDPAQYGDFTDLPDLKSVLERVHDVHESFMSLDPKMRARFDNQPWKMWDFANDPENFDQCVKWGIFLPREAPPAPDGQGAVPQATSSSSPPSPSAS